MAKFGVDLVGGGGDISMTLQNYLHTTPCNLPLPTLSRAPTTAPFTTRRTMSTSGVDTPSDCYAANAKVE